MKHDIMFGILITLLNKGRTNAKTLAQKFEVSTKTIYRYLSVLESSGVPTISYAGRYGGLEIASTFSLSSCFFSKQEISEIMSLVSNSTIPKFSNACNMVAEKLNHTLKNTKNYEFSQEFHSSIIIDTSPWGKQVHQKDINTELLKAIEMSKVIEIVYDTDKGYQNRLLQPYSLIFKDGSFYLIAFCNMRNDFRLFKLTRIVSANITEEIFIRKNISQEEFFKKINTSFERVQITIKTHDIVTNDILEWLTDYDIKVQNNEKIIKGTAVKNRGLIHKIMSYENKLKIISPKWLKDELINICNKICNGY